MQSTITNGRYVLAVKDLKASASYYIEKLGFKTVWEDSGWHCVVRDSIYIMMGECANERPASELGDHSYFAYFDVANIDGLYEEYQSKGVAFLSTIEDKPWGQREFSVKTIDGHRIMFGEAVVS